MRAPTHSTLCAHAFGIIGITVCAALATVTPAVRAQTRFDPLKHFPAKPLLFASVHDVARLRERLSSTLLGRIATHPGWKEALAAPIAMLDRLGADGVAQFREK